MADEFDLPEAEEEAPVSAVRKQRNLGRYMENLQRSWEQDTALGVTVPADKAKGVESRFRQAASELGMGVKIAHRPNGDGTVRVVFQAAEKRVYTARKAGGQRKAAKSKKSA